MIITPFCRVVARHDNSPGTSLRHRTQIRDRAALQGGPTVIVIPRKKGQRVVIDDEIILTVIEVRADKVRLGVELPEGVAIYKLDAYEAITGPKQTQSN